MARKYFPALGDVVCYGGKRRVIVHIEKPGIAYPVYFFSFLDENLIKDCSFIETEVLIKKSIRDMWVPEDSNEEPPFTKIDVTPYKIEQINYTIINT